MSLLTELAAFGWWRSTNMSRPRRFGSRGSRLKKIGWRTAGFISSSHQAGSHWDNLPELRAFFPKARQQLRAAAVSAGKQRPPGV